VGWCPLLLCKGNSVILLSPFFLWHMNLSTADLRNYWTEFQCFKQNSSKVQMLN
jgi:hypothetical protein